MPSNRPPSRAPQRRRPPASAATRASGPARRGAPRSKAAPTVLRPYRPRRRRSIWPLVAWLLVIAGLAYGGWRAYAALTTPDTPAAPDSSSPVAQTDGPAEAKPAATTPVEDPTAGTAADEIEVASFLGSGPSRDLTGFGPEAPDALGLVWKLRLGGGTTQRKADNKPVVWSGNGWTGQPTVVKNADGTWLLLGAYDHNLHRINAENGKVKWEAEWPDVMKGTNTVVANPDPDASDETRLIVVSGSRRGSNLSVGDERIAPLRAVSFASGKELWRLPVPKTANYSQDVDASPLWHEGVLYCSVESGYVYAVDPFTTVAKNGHREPKVLARSRKLYDAEDVQRHPDTGGANLALESSPSAIGDRIYVTSGSGHIYGLDRRTLKVVWDFKTGSDIDGTPVVTKDKKLLVTIEKQYVDERGGAYLLDPTKPPRDAVVWYCPTPTKGFGEWAGGSVSSFTTNESENDGSKPRLAAFNSIDGQVRLVSIDQLTSKKAKGPGPAGPAPAPVEIFSDGIGGSISTPVLVGDRLVTAGYGNRVYLYKLTYSASSSGAKGALPSPDGRWWKVKVKRTDSFAGGAAFEATPLVYEGRVYIGCRDGYLYCLGR